MDDLKSEELIISKTETYIKKTPDKRSCSLDQNFSTGYATHSKEIARITPGRYSSVVNSWKIPLSNKYSCSFDNQTNLNSFFDGINTRHDKKFNTVVNKDIHHIPRRSKQFKTSEVKHKTEGEGIPTHSCNPSTSCLTKSSSENLPVKEITVTMPLQDFNQKDKKENEKEEEEEVKSKPKEISSDSEKKAINDNEKYFEKALQKMDKKIEEMKTQEGNQKEKEKEDPILQDKKFSLSFSNEFPFMFNPPHLKYEKKKFHRGNNFSGGFAPESDERFSFSGKKPLYQMTDKKKFQPRNLSYDLLPLPMHGGKDNMEQNRVISKNNFSAREYSSNSNSKMCNSNNVRYDNTCEDRNKPVNREKLLQTSTARSLSRTPFERLKLKLEGDFIHFLKRHRFSAVLTGNKQFEGKTGNYYLMMKNLNFETTATSMLEKENPSQAISKTHLNFNLDSLNCETINSRYSDANVNLNVNNEDAQFYTRPNVPPTGFQTSKKLQMPVNLKKNGNIMKSKRENLKSFDRDQEVQQVHMQTQRGRKKNENSSTNKNSSYNTVNDRKIKPKAIPTENKNSFAGNNLHEYRTYQNIYNVPTNCIDLTPLPVKKHHETKIVDQEYSTAERAAVLIRRIEYSNNMKYQKFLSSKEATEMYYNLLLEAKVIVIQRWWRCLRKNLIVKNINANIIQKVFRGYLTRIAYSTALRQMNQVFPFLSSVIFVFEKRKIKITFNKLYVLYAQKAQNKILLSKVKIIKSAFLAYLNRKKQVKNKLEKLCIAISKVFFQKNFGIFKQWDRILKKIITLQSTFRGNDYRSNEKKILYQGRNIQPLLYFFLKYNNPNAITNFKDLLYLWKKEKFNRIAKRIKYISIKSKVNLLLEKLRKLAKKISYRKHFHNFLKRLHSFKVVQMRIKKMKISLNAMTPVFKKAFLRKFFKNWRLFNWKSKNYCRLGINLFGKILKFCYWQNVMKALQSKKEEDIQNQKLKKMFLFKEKDVKKERFRKLKRYVKHCQKREGKMIKFLIKKDLMIKLNTLHRWRNCVFYKNKRFNYSYRISQGFNMIKNSCTSKIRNEYSLSKNSNGFKKLFINSKIYSRLGLLLSIAKKCQKENRKKLFKKWRENLLKINNSNKLKLIKLKNVFKIAKQRKKNSMRKNLLSYYLTTNKQRIAEKYSNNQIALFTHINMGSLIVDKYSNNIYDNNAIEQIRKGKNKIIAQFFTLFLIGNINRHILHAKTSALRNIYQNAKKKKLRKIYLKEIMNQVTFKAYLNDQQYFQKWKRETFGERVSKRIFKIKTQEEKENSKVRLLTQFLFNKNQRQSNYVNFYFSQWKNILVLENIKKSADKIKSHSRKILNKIQQKKQFTKQNQVMSAKQSTLNKLIGVKVKRILTRLEIIFHKWKSCSQLISLAVKSGIIKHFCRNVLKKMNKAKIKRKLFSPFLIRLCMNEFLLFAKKKLNIKRALHTMKILCHNFLQRNFQTIRHYEKLRCEHKNIQELNHLKNQKLLFRVLSVEKKHDANVFDKFFRWKNLYAIESIKSSANTIAQHAIKILTKIRVLKSTNLLQIKELLKISSRVNKLRRFKLIVRGKVIFKIFSFVFGKIKLRARCHMIKTIISHSVNQRFFFVFKKWKFLSRIFQRKSQLVQRMFRKAREIQNREMANIKISTIKGLIGNLISKQEKYTKFYWTKMKRATNVFIVPTKHKNVQMFCMNKNRQLYKDKKIGFLKYLIHTFNERHNSEIGLFKILAANFRFWKNKEKFRRLKSMIFHFLKYVEFCENYHTEIEKRLYFIKWKKFNIMFNILKSAIKIQNRWRLFMFFRRIRTKSIVVLYQKWNYYLEKMQRMEEILTGVFTRVLRLSFNILISKVKVYSMSIDIRKFILNTHLVRIIQRTIAKFVFNSIRKLKFKYHTGRYSQHALSASKITRTFSFFDNKEQQQNILPRFVTAKSTKIQFILLKYFRQFIRNVKYTKVTQNILVIQRCAKKKLKRIHDITLTRQMMRRYYIKTIALALKFVKKGERN